MNRSPRVTTAGASRWMRAYTRAWLLRGRDAAQHLARAPVKRTRAPWRSGVASGNSSRRASSRRVGSNDCDGSVSPRATSDTSTPPRFTATRCRPPPRPGCAVHLESARVHRAAGPASATRLSSFWPTRPTTSVPVTTVPKPFIVKTRSIGSRAGRRSAGGAARAPPRRQRRAQRRSSPSPVATDTRHHRAHPRETTRPRARAPRAQRAPASRRRRDRLLVSTMRPRRARRAAGRCRSARASAASPIRRAATTSSDADRCRRRRPACS